MAEFPSLPLFTDAWIADTKHLTRLERGTYHDLLVLMWRTPDCHVPNDDVWLGKRLGMTPDEVRSELRPIISEFIQTDGNWLFQKRLRKEWEWCRQHGKKQSDRAKSRWNKEKSECRGNATPGNAPTPTPTPTEEPSLRSGARAKATRLPADWNPSELDMQAAAKRGLVGHDLRSEIEKFRNYWHAKSGRDATKLDWPATWRNWIINWSERRGKQPGNPRAAHESAVLAGFSRAFGDRDGGLAGPADEEIPRGRYELDL